MKFIPDYIPIPSATIEDYIKAAIEQTIAAIKAQQKTTNRTSSNLTPITSYVQVSKLLNNNLIVKSDNTIYKHTPTNNLCNPEMTQSLYQQLRPQKKVEHNINKSKGSKPLTDDEFDNLLKNLRKPKTLPRVKHCARKIHITIIIQMHINITLGIQIYQHQKGQDVTAIRIIISL